MQITGRVRIKNQQWRYDPDTGFLRCTAVLLQAGVLAYPRAEVRAPHDFKPTQETLYIRVPPEAISDPASLQSLEGTPVVAGSHVWQTSENAAQRCGAIAGTPYFDGEDLVGDVLVTDRDTSRRIMLPAGDPEKLEELSTAFDSMVNFEDGYSECGPHDGFFSQIRYNHTAILPAGAARGGSTVRIVNTREQPMPMPTELTRIKLRSGQFVRVANEDVKAVEDDQAATDKEVENSVDAGQVNDLMAQVTELNQQIATLTAERDEAAGKLQAVKEQLEAALDPSAVEAAAEGLANERDDATKVMNAHGKQMTDEQKKLRGHALRVSVLNSVRTAPLGDEQAKNEGFVSGMFEVLKGTKPAATVPPAGAVQIVNSQPPATADAPDMSDPDARRRRLYPHLYKQAAK